MPIRTKKTTSKAKKPARKVKAIKNEVVQPAPVVLPEISKKISEEFQLDTAPTQTEPIQTTPKTEIQKSVPENTQPTTVTPIKEFIPVTYEQENAPGHVKTLRALMYSVLFIWAAGIVMYYIYLPQQPQRLAVNPTPTDVQNAPTTPPTVTPTTDVKSYKIAVLNGSGRAGAAGATKTLLETAGYSISFVGNASKRQEKTTIYLSPEVSTSIIESLGSIIGEISETYVQPSLPSGETAQVIIIVGSN